MTPRLHRPAADECSPYYFTYIQLVSEGDIVDTLRTQHPALHELVRGLAEEQAAARPTPEDWSAKEVLQHLIDAERLFAFRALWFARGEQAALPGMEPNPWVANSHANARPRADLLDELAHVRAASVALFANLDEEGWMRRGSASGAVVSVRALAWIVAGHELHHLRSLHDEYVGQRAHL